MSKTTDGRKSTRESIGRVGLELIKQAVGLASDHFSSTNLPTYEFQTGWIEEESETSRRYRPATAIRPDPGFAYAEIFKQLEETGLTQKLIDSIIQLEKLLKSEPQVVWFDPHDAYPQQLVTDYLATSGSIDYDESTAEEAIGRLLEHVEAKSEEWCTVAVLEDFSAPGPIRLDASVYIQPMQKDQLENMGRDYGEELAHMETDRTKAGHRLRFPSSQAPDADWWLIEAITTGQKGSLEAQNKSNRVLDPLIEALRVLKPGKIVVGRTVGQGRGPYGGIGMSKSGNSQWLSGDESYSLNEEEVDNLIDLWPRIRRLGTNKKHFLRVPLNRLMFGGERRRPEDALIDYIIGCEALLSLANERTELRYRFSVRGAVVISGSHSERPANFRAMKRLYDLRSKLVHGATVDPKSLNLRAREAEAVLRSLLLWYLNNWTDSKNNTQAIAKIDKDLLLADA